MADAADMGECDFVENFAAPLPLQVICDMLGVPAADEKQIFDWTNVILGAGDPDFGGTFEALFEGALGMYNYAQALGQDRLDHPGEDLVSILMHADVDGQRLTPAEFGSFFILLAVAGNETTRNAISWGMKMLTEHPDQLRDWQADPTGMTPNAIEEIVRWASPVIHMRRIALEDTRIGDTDIAAGDKVVMWYWSANRDETVFPDGHALRSAPRQRQGAGRLRRRRPALLPRRQPRPAGDHRDVRGDVPVVPRSPDHQRTRPPAVAVHQRHQADGLRVHTEQGLARPRQLTRQPYGDRLVEELDEAVHGLAARHARGVRSRLDAAEHALTRLHLIDPAMHPGFSHGLEEIQQRLTAQSVRPGQLDRLHHERTWLGDGQGQLRRAARTPFPCLVPFGQDAPHVPLDVGDAA